MSFILSIIIIVIYFKNETTKPLAKSNLQEPTMPVDLANKPSSYSSPEKNTNEDWFNSEILYLFNHFIDSGNGNLVAIDKIFNDYCRPLSYCVELTELFVRYMEYKKSFSELAIDDDDRNNIEIIYQAREDLKNEYFSAYEQSVLFGLETDWDIQMLERRNILTDSNLSESQKREAIVQHIENLPQAQKLDFKNTLNLNKVMELDEKDKLVEENFNELAAEFSPEAAQRLIDDQQEQTQWQARIDTYKSYKNEVQALHQGDEQLIEMLLRSFLSDNFTSKEIKRVKVLVR